MKSSPNSDSDSWEEVPDEIALAPLYSSTDYVVLKSLSEYVDF
jgi:hypothetical protein